MERGKVVVSLRSRGFGSFNHAFFDVRRQTFSFGRQTIDVVLGLLLTFFHLSWTAWIAIVVALITVLEGMSPYSWVYFRPEVDDNKTVMGDSDAAVSLFLPFIGAMFLPVLALVVMVFWRREHALRYLAGFKSYTVGICRSARHADEEASEGHLHAGAEAIQRQASAMLDDLRRYLHHKRPYARHFYLPYIVTAKSNIPGDSTLARTSRDIGVLLRKVHRSVRDLHGAVQMLRRAGANEEHVDALMEQVVALHGCLEHLCNMKETRTPVMLRTTVRWFSVVIFPVYLGFYCASIHSISTTLGASVGVLAMAVEIALMVAVDLTISMEDPFDDVAMDTLSVMETLGACSVNAMIGPLSDNTPEDQGHTTTTYLVQNTTLEGKVETAGVPQDVVHAGRLDGGGRLMMSQPQQQPEPASASGGRRSDAAGTAVHTGSASQGPRPKATSTPAEKHKPAVFTPPPMPPMAGGGYIAGVIG